MARPGGQSAWRLYERVVAAIQSEDSSAQLTVIPNAHLVGSLSGARRQIDVLVDARVAEDVTRRVIIDAKFRSRPINVRDVETFEGMMKDCRAIRGVIVCTSGYTPAAERRAQQSITITLLPASEIEDLDLSQWDLCVGRCAEAAKARELHGWVLYNDVFHIGSMAAPVSASAIGKCDGCGDFHIWCWDCGQRFALIGDEAEAKCACDRFWLTAVEDEGFDEAGNSLEAVVLIAVTLPEGAWAVLDRRPLA